MTTPAHMLRLRLFGRDLIDLRTASGELEGRISYTDAIALAVRGVVEGVGPRSGEVRYVRRLPAAAVESTPEVQEARLDLRFPSAASIIARTNLGVRKEPLRQAIVEEFLGHRYVTREGEVQGYCYQFCRCSL